MKNLAAMSVGAVMLAVAFFLADRTTSQETAPRPEAAMVFATELHRLPTSTPTDTPAPTVTLTPVATTTPIPGWTELKSSLFAMWLPQVYRAVLSSVPEESANSRKNDGATFEGLITYGVDWKGSSFLKLIWSISVYRVAALASGDPLPYGSLGANLKSFYREEPTPVSLGRYAGYAMITPGSVISTMVTKQALYWIKHGNFYWLVVYTSPSTEFDDRLPIFEESMQSFTILRDE